MKVLIWFSLIGLAVTATEVDNQEDREMYYRNLPRSSRSQFSYRSGERESNEEDASEDVETSSEHGESEDSGEYSYDDDPYWALPPQQTEYNTKPVGTFVTFGTYPHLFAAAQYQAKPVSGGYSSPWVPIIPIHTYKHPVHRTVHS